MIPLDTRPQTQQLPDAIKMGQTDTVIQCAACMHICLRARFVCLQKQYKLIGTLTHADACLLMSPSPHLFQDTAAASAAVGGGGNVQMGWVWRPYSNVLGRLDQGVDCKCFGNYILGFTCGKCSARNTLPDEDRWRNNFNFLCSHCHAPCAVGNEELMLAGYEPHQQGVCVCMYACVCVGGVCNDAGLLRHRSYR